MRTMSFGYIEGIYVCLFVMYSGIHLQYNFAGINLRNYYRTKCKYNMNELCIFKTIHFVGTLQSCSIFILVCICWGGGVGCVCLREGVLCCLVIIKQDRI